MSFIYAISNMDQINKMDSEYTNQKNKTKNKKTTNGD